MNKLVLTLAGAVWVAAAPAFAADMAVKSAPFVRPAETYNWTGFYVGLNLGGSFGRHGTTDTGVYDAPALPASVLLYNESFSHSPAGVIAGLQGGYNWQASNYVFGIEADWQWSSQRDTSCVFGCGATTAAFFGPGGAGFNNALNSEQKIDWLATQRARIGYASEGWLWYLTGGAAEGRVRNNMSLTSNNVVGTLFAPGTSIANFGRDRLGWTVGGGVETKLWGGWTAKMEYLYVDLGSFTDTFIIPGGTALPNATFTTTSAYHVTDHIVRAGLNYRFNTGGPILAKY